MKMDNTTKVHDGKKPFTCDLCDCVAQHLQIAGLGQDIQSVNEGKNPFVFVST